MFRAIDYRLRLKALALTQQTISTAVDAANQKAVTAQATATTAQQTVNAQASTILSQGMSISGLQASLQAAVAKIPPNLVLPGTFTVDTLPTPSAANLGMYAVVTDLFGAKIDKVLCSLASSTYFWQPVRPVYAAKMSLSADVTLTALKSPSVAFLTGSLLSGLTRSVTISPSLAFPGASFRFKNSMTGLGTLRILNVNLGTPLSIILGGTQEFIYDMTDGWLQIT